MIEQATETLLEDLQLLMGRGVQLRIPAVEADIPGLGHVEFRQTQSGWVCKIEAGGGRPLIRKRLALAVMGAILITRDRVQKEADRARDSERRRSALLESVAKILGDYAEPEPEPEPEQKPKRKRKRK